MRIVLDTNVLVRSILNPAGPAAEVLRLSCGAGHVLLLSRPILDEVFRVLRYDRLQRIHGLSEEEIPQAAALLERASQWIMDAPLPGPVVVQDPNDDAIVAAALAGDAEVICTRDKHLHDPSVRRWCKQHGIRVMDDIELLQLLRSECSQ